jgi:hypothetical protein
MQRISLLFLTLVVAGGAPVGALEGTQSVRSRAPYARHSSHEIRSVPATGSATDGVSSIEAYDCSFTQSGFIAVNPCTGNDMTETATVQCIGTYSVRPDGVVVDAGYNSSVHSIWTDTGTGDVFVLSGRGIVVQTENHAANDVVSILIEFRGLARGKRQDIRGDWHGLVVIDGQTGDVTELGVPGPTFSDGLTCVNHHH